MEFANRQISNARRSPNAVGIAATILILFIVWVIMFPIFAGSHPDGGHESCVSNLKQLGLGLMQYQQDYDEKLPLRQYVGTGGRIVSWRQEVMPYIKYRPAFRDPRDRAMRYSDIEHDGFPRSFGVNSLRSGGNGHAGPFADAKGGSSTMDELGSPATVILVAESTAAFNDFNLLAPAQFMSSTSPGSNAGHLFARSGDNYANPSTGMLFGDGHAKMTNPFHTIGSELSTPNEWTIDNTPFSREDGATAQQVIDFGVKHSVEDTQDPPR